MYPNMINELVAYQTSLGEHYVPRRKPCSRYTKKRSAGPSSNWRIKMFVSSERPSSLGKTTLKPYQVRDQLGLDTVGGIPGKTMPAQESTIMIHLPNLGLVIPPSSNVQALRDYSMHQKKDKNISQTCKPSCPNGWDFPVTQVIWMMLTDRLPVGLPRSSVTTSTGKAPFPRKMVGCASSRKCLFLSRDIFLMN